MEDKKVDGVTEKLELVKSSRPRSNNSLRPNPLFQSFSEIFRCVPIDEIILAYIEMELTEIILLTSPNHW